MGRPQYCVYNQTSESFLSLGIKHSDSILAYLRGLLADRAPRYDEGSWVAQPRRIDFFRLTSSRDLVFLDQKQRVLGTIESFPRMRFAPLGPEVASVLSLPVHTISSSQTQAGNQLVICAAEELQFRLRRFPDPSKEELSDPLFATRASRSLQRWAGHCPTPDRRATRRKRWPRLIAYDSILGSLEVHGVKDLSASGLYLITHERWPLGSPVTMTLQRTDSVDDNLQNNAVTVQLRVIRWGQDGVGLEFDQPAKDECPLLALTSA